MATDFRPLGIDNLEHAAHIMNGSSRGRSFEFNLDVTQFLALARFWSFSYGHSYVGYLHGEPAGIVLNSVDADAREGYSFYWGVLPEFRNRPFSLRLARYYLDQAGREGYRQTSADVSHDSPHSIYARLGYRPALEWLELRTHEPAPAAAREGYEFRYISGIDAPVTRAARHWTQRAYFRRQAESFLECVGAFRGDRMEAYILATRWPGYTMILDYALPAPAGDAGSALIRYLLETGYPRPMIAAYVRDGSREHASLLAMGFQSPRRFSMLTLAY